MIRKPRKPKTNRSKPYTGHRAKVRAALQAGPLSSSEIAAKTGLFIWEISAACSCDPTIENIGRVIEKGRANIWKLKDEAQLAASGEGT